MLFLLAVRKEKEFGSMRITHFSKNVFLQFFTISNENERYFHQSKYTGFCEIMLYITQNISSFFVGNLFIETVSKNTKNQFSMNFKTTFSPENLNKTYTVTIQKEK